MPNSPLCCSKRLIPLRALLWIGNSLIFSLFNLISPKSGKIFPTIRLNKVDFPAPLGPSNPKICPWFKDKEIFFKIGLPPKVFEIFDMLKIFLFVFLFCSLNFIMFVEAILICFLLSFWSLCANNLLFMIFVNIKISLSSYRNFFFNNNVLFSAVTALILILFFC